MFKCTSHKNILIHIGFKSVIRLRVRFDFYWLRGVGLADFFLSRTMLHDWTLSRTKNALKTRTRLRNVKIILKIHSIGTYNNILSLDLVSLKIPAVENWSNYRMDNSKLICAVCRLSSLWILICKVLELVSTAGRTFTCFLLSGFLLQPNS
jgi:hypothetical protein